MRSLGHLSLTLFIVSVACSGQITAADKAPPPLKLDPVPLLPGWLREYAEDIEGMKKPTGRQGPFPQLAKLRLVQYVKAKTGAWHDQEVSRLIFAALEKPYDEDAHRMWRMRWYDRLK